MPADMHVYAVTHAPTSVLPFNDPFRVPTTKSLPHFYPPTPFGLASTASSPLDASGRTGARSPQIWQLLAFGPPIYYYSLPPITVVPVIDMDNPLSAALFPLEPLV